MKTHMTIISFFLLMFSTSSGYAAFPTRRGINPVALATIRPVFVPWQRCNATIDRSIKDYRHHSYDLMEKDGYEIEFQCHKALLFVESIKLKGSLAHNPFMEDALSKLLQVFGLKEYFGDTFVNFHVCMIGDTVCYSHMGGDVGGSLRSMESIDPSATRFWYDLDHTA